MYKLGLNALKSNLICQTLLTSNHANNFIKSFNYTGVENSAICYGKISLIESAAYLFQDVIRKSICSL
jgi:hypothetical protein